MMLNLKSEPSSSNLIGRNRKHHNFLNDRDENGHFLNENRILGRWLIFWTTSKSQNIQNVNQNLK